MKSSFAKLLTVLLLVVMTASMGVFAAPQIQASACFDERVQEMPTVEKTADVLNERIAQRRKAERENKAVLMDDVYTYGVLQYCIWDDEAVIVGCDESATTVTIPSYINGCPVTVIDSFAFEMHENLESIYIPATVYDIGFDVFFGCYNLERITVDSSNAYYSSDADGVLYDKEKLTLIKYPAGRYVSSYSIADSVEMIFSYAFEDSMIESITIPASVNYIEMGGLAFAYNVTNIYVDPENEFYSSDANGVLYDEDKTTIVQYPVGKTASSYSIPSGVTVIGDYAFDCCDALLYIYNTDNIEYIGEWAFQNTGYYNNDYNWGNGVLYLGNHLLSLGFNDEIQNFTVKDGTKTIAGGAFMNCTSLEKVTLPDGLVSMGSWAFSYCSSLTEIELPSTLNTIGYSAFEGCLSLESIVIPETITEISYQTFSGCESLTSITIPKSVTNIGYGAFRDCYNLATVYYGGSQTGWNGVEIDDDNNYLLDAEIICKGSSGGGGGGGVTPTPVLASGTCGDNLEWTLYTNGNLAISGNGDMDDWSSALAPWYEYRDSIKTVDIGDNVTSIGNYAFYNCTSITSVTLGDSLSSIGDDAFEYCTGLTSIEIPDSVTSIGSSVFAYCTVLTGIEIPDTVTSLGNSAFSYCTGLTSVTIPDNVTSIGRSVFEHCTSLASVTIPDNVTSIGSSAFSYCASLTRVTIHDNIIGIGRGAFAYCTGLTGVTIGDNVTSIGDGAFEYCTSLTSITIPDSVTSIGEWAFGDCTGITNVTMGDSVIRIGTGAFYNCISLATVQIPVSVKIISNSAFESCRKLSDVYYGGSKTQWESIQIGEYNESLTGAGITFSVVDPDPVKYTVTYNANGGSGAPASETFIQGYGVNVSVVVPTRDGYTFKGWSTTANGQVEYASGSVYTANADVTLYAVWEKVQTPVDPDDPVDPKPVDPDATVVEVSSVRTLAGKQVVLTFDLKNNPGIAGLAMAIKYDSRLVLEKIEKGNALSSLSFMPPQDNVTANPVGMTWFSTTDDTTNGTLVTATFTVPEGTPEGEYKVEAVIAEDGASNAAFEYIEIATISGAINVIDVIIGDVTGDERVNIQDVILLAQYCAGWDSAKEKANLLAADVTADGRVNIQDVILLAQFCAGWNVTLG